MHVRTYVCLFVCVYACMCVCERVYSYTHMNRGIELIGELEEAHINVVAADEFVRTKSQNVLLQSPLPLVNQPLFVCLCVCVRACVRVCVRERELNRTSQGGACTF